MRLLRRVVKKSCEGSSMKALPRIMRAPTTIQRILWVLALLVGMVAAVYQLARLVLGYLDYETSMNIVTEQGPPPFPDVTICHLDLNWTFRMLENEAGEEMTMAKHVQMVQRLQANYPSDSNEYKYLENVKNFRGYLQNNKRIHTEVETLRNMFIIDCYSFPSWDRTKCGSKDVNSSVFLDPYFGLCVTFKSNHHELRGLTLVLYLDDPEIDEPKTFNLSVDGNTHTSVVGARVVIHPPNSFPDIFLTSHHVHAGVDMAFNLEGTKRSVLDEPYGSCISQEEADEALRAGKHGYAINRHGYECWRMCAKDYVLDKCDCIDIYYTPSEKERDDLKLCGYIYEDNVNATLDRLDCAERVIDYLHPQFEELCTCPIPCEQFTYRYATKSIEWPHDPYHLSFYQQYIRNSSFASRFTEYEALLNASNSNQTGTMKKVRELTKIRKNFAQISILNHQKTHFHFSETPLISPEALFGNVGGLLNLWVGITFITIIEIMEFIYTLCQSEEKDKTTQNGKTKNATMDPTTDELLRKA